MWGEDPSGLALPQLSNIDMYFWFYGISRYFMATYFDNFVNNDL